MFYRTDQPHGLPRNPFNALVAPRPIGWISSVDAQGRVNLAPYSFFNAVAYVPPQVMYASTGNHSEGGLKDTARNIQETGEFVVNLATWTLREAMNRSSAPAPHGTDEFELAGLTAVPSSEVAPPRVKESPVHLECRMTQVVTLKSANPEEPNLVTFGEVVGIHIDDAVLEDGFVKPERLDLISRLGYMDYARVSDVFTMDRPSWPG